MIVPRSASRLVTVAALVAANACARQQVQVVTPSVEPSRLAWASTLQQATAEVTAGRPAAADKLYADFVTRFPASAETAEALFYRGLLRLDPAAGLLNPREAVSLLDAYLASGNSLHRFEAAALRRTASALDARPAPSGGSGSSASARADDRARDEELARVKEELAKANAELERIRRRLAKP